MSNFHSHDYAHCNQALCSKKDTCFRYLLYLEDIEYHHKTGNEMYCSYVEIPQEDTPCELYIPRKLT